MYNFPELNGMVGMYHSRMDPDIKEAEKEKLIILSTIKSCGAATDIKGLQLTINLANPFSSNVIARQTLGRTRDKGTMYIDVVDTGFATLRGYYKHKQGIFSKYALDFRMSSCERICCMKSTCRCSLTRWNGITNSTLKIQIKRRK